MLDTSDYGSIINLKSRKLVFIDEDKEVVFFMAKPYDVPVYVGSGAADIGIVGKDVLMESESQAYEILDLKTCSCRMVLAGPLPKDNVRPIVRKIATKYPRISAEYFDSKSEAVEINQTVRLNRACPTYGIIGCHS